MKIGVLTDMSGPYSGYGQRWLGSGWKVVAQKMRELPIQDPIMRNVGILPDGRVVHGMYLFQVKKPS